MIQFDGGFFEKSSSKIWIFQIICLSLTRQLRKTGDIEESNLALTRKKAHTLCLRMDRLKT